VTQEFDYIVVGAGSAGVLAARLSEAAEVLRIEAGHSNRRLYVKMPVAFRTTGLNGSRT
jgi:choline dehydrogenase-like flavoprotein